MWAGYDSTEDGLLHRLTPRNVAAMRATRRSRPRPARVFRRMARRVRRSRPVKFRACKRAWDTVEGSFLDAGAEDIVDTIMPGMPRRHLEDLAAFLGRVRKAPSSPLHPDIELLYRLRGGQVVYVSPCCPVVEGLDYRAPDERELCTFPMGLFGGHFFYGQMPCVRFLPLDMFLFRHGIPTAGCTEGLLPVAADHGGTGDGDGLVVCVDTRDGVPYVCDRSVFGPGLIDGARVRAPAARHRVGLVSGIRDAVADGVYAPRDVSNLHPSFRKMMWRIPRVSLDNQLGWVGIPETEVCEATTRDALRVRVASAPHRRRGDRGHPTLHILRAHGHLERGGTAPTVEW